MKKTSTLLACLLLVAFLPIGSASAARPAPIYGYITMSDGVSLKYQAMLPDPNVWGPGPYPLVMDYSGYIPAEAIYDGLKDRFRESGYAVIGLNIRGSHCSGGTFDYFEPRQAVDGKEAIEFLTQDPTRPAWSNGRLAMVGKSYPGITQLFVAAQQPKGLVSIVPGHVFGDLYRDVPYPGGILNATFAGAWSGQRAAETMYSGYNWWGNEFAKGRNDQQCLENQPAHAPNTAVNPFVQALYNQFDGPLFWQRSPWWFADKIKVPTLLVEAWQDEQVGSRATNLLERFGGPTKFLGANGDHGEYYGEEMLPHIYRFLEFTLRGSSTVPSNFWSGYGSVSAYDRPALRNLGFATATDAEYWAEPGITINFENGANGGRKAAFSRSFTQWPPAETTVERYYLDADASMSTTAPAEQVPANRAEALNAREAGAVDYVYTPGLGTQERGGISIAGEPATGDWKRKPPTGTFAAFTTDALDADRMMVGTASVDLYISSTMPDTDLEVTLSEVRTDGVEMFVQQGWLRASHRIEDPRFSTELRPFQSHKLGDQAVLVPGHPSLARVEMFPFAHVFRKGSKMRIWVTAPHVRPDYWGFAALPQTSVNTIFASHFYPSSVAFPVIAGGSAPTELAPCTLRNQPCRPEA